MLNRYLWVIFLCFAVVACSEKTEQNNALWHEVPVNTKDEVIITAEEPSLAKTPLAPSVSQAQLATPLDLSLPASERPDIQDWNAQDKSRYGVDTWFEHEPSEESRLKLKTKLLIKEGAQFDKNTKFSGYSDSVDGAEMGFEYKTR